MFLIFNFFVFLFGLCIGSFLNYVIYRLDTHNFSFLENLVNIKRSYCPHCKHTLIWTDLIPVFSFLFLKGRCRYCHKKISIQYPMVEISTALMFLLIFNFQFSIINEFLIFNFQNLVSLCFLLIVSCFLIIIFVYDLKHYIIPDKVLFPAIIITFLYRLFENLFNRNLIENWLLKIENFAPLFNYLLAVFLAAGFFLAIFLISHGKWMGFGDVKLAILLGLLLGFPNILLGLFLAFFFGAIIGVGLMFFGKKGLKSEIPFAPFLIIGTFIAMFWSQEIFNWYISLILNF